jgi:hypothetical protein
MTAAERLVAAFARGLMQGLLQAQAPDPEEPPSLVWPEPRVVARPRIPDIEHPPEEIDLFARMKDEMAQGDADLSDVAMVEQALREAAAARERDASNPVVEGTRRVRAPDV